MASYTGKSIMENMIRAYNFFAENQNATIRDLSDELGLQSSSARSRVHMMVGHGFLVQSGTAPAGRIQAATFSAVEGVDIGNWLPPPELPKASQMPTRPVVKAVQIGMGRDPLIAALFGPARAEVAA